MGKKGGGGQKGFMKQVIKSKRSDVQENKIEEEIEIKENDEISNIKEKLTEEQDEEEEEEETKTKMKKRHTRELQALKKGKKITKSNKDEVQKLIEEMMERHNRELSKFDDNDDNDGVKEEKERQKQAEEEEEERKKNEIREKNFMKEKKKREEKERKEKERMEMLRKEKEELGESERIKEERQLNNKLKKYGFKIEEIKADGNCLYRAIEHQMKELKMTPKYDYNELRKLASEYMLKNKDKFISFYSIEEEDNQSYEEYCQKIKDTILWGGELELQALASALNKDIVVHSLDLPNNILKGNITSDNDINNSINVVFRKYAYGLGNHYDSVILLNYNAMENI